MENRYGIQSFAEEILSQVDAHFALEQEIYAAYKNEQAKIRSKKVRRIAYICLASVIAVTILLTQVILPKVNYDKAMKYIENENYIGAFTLLRQIKNYRLGTYKDSVEQMSQIKMDYVSQMCRTAEVGDILFFGHDPTAVYENTMAWQVLKRENNKILVISRSCLSEKRKYADLGENYYYKSWDTSEIRSWLNKDFLGGAFDEKERAAIVVSTVTKSGIPEETTGDSSASYSYYPGELGSNTNDKVFLLSIAEAKKYMKVINTTGAKKYMKVINTTGAYWLRSSGYCVRSSRWGELYHTFVVSKAAYVRDNGTIDEYGTSQENNYGVRPAMWISAGS